MRKEGREVTRPRYSRDAEPCARLGPLITMADNDYYETLGVRPTDSAENITQAYRQLARQYHPDTNPGNSDAATRFKEINVAYQTLSDPAKRAQYDAERATSAQSALTSEAPMTPQDEQAIVIQRSVTLNGADIDAALNDLRSTMSDAANEVADELRGALSDFARELDAIARTGGDVSKYRSHRQGFPPPPPQHGGPPKQKRR